MVTIWPVQAPQPVQVRFPGPQSEWERWQEQEIQLVFEEVQVLELASPVPACTRRR
jgi:hypothetical protein